MIKLLFFFLSMNTLAAIYGEDSRIETFESNENLQLLAKSVPALIHKDRIELNQFGNYEVKGKPMLEFGFCSDARFVEETNIANCSSSLVAPNLILTAAHCLDENYYACENYRFVFDYIRKEEDLVVRHEFTPDQVYQCKQIIYSKFEFGKVFGEDLALIELDRPAVGRKPIKVLTKYNFRSKEPLTMIGYPLGVSQKVVPEGKFVKLDAPNVSFSHTLDTFSVNSGGPIFNQEGHQVGVLVRDYGVNFTDYGERGCYDWTRAEKGVAAEGNFLSPLSKFFQDTN